MNNVYTVHDVLSIRIDKIKRKVQGKSAIAVKRSLNVIGQYKSYILYHCESIIILYFIIENICILIHSKYHANVSYTKSPSA